eukprot:5029169-Lingulodinium_polyedra.AAC.1
MAVFTLRSTASSEHVLVASTSKNGYAAPFSDLRNTFRKNGGNIDQPCSRRAETKPMPRLHA